MAQNYSTHTPPAGESVAPTAGSPIVSEEKTQYVKQCFEAAKKHNDSLVDVNVENRLFYEGIDKELDARKADATVVRSAIFIPEVAPAINTRVAAVIAKAQERDAPISILPRMKDAPSDVFEQCRWIQQQIFEQMMACGYLYDGLHEQVLAAELYRTPSTVRCGWEPIWERQAVITKGNLSTTEYIKQVQIAAATGSPLPPVKPSVEFKNVKNGGRPYALWREPESFIYQPDVSRFEDSDYAFDVNWMAWEKLLAMAEQYDWNQELIEKYKGELAEANLYGGDKKTVANTIKSEHGLANELSTGFKDDKICVAEGYLVEWGKDGSKKINFVVYIGNRYVVKYEESDLKLITLPFVPVVSQRMPGTLESLSSMDISKYMQRLYNEIFNSWIDAITYQIFPPFKCQTGTTFKGTPVFGPGRIWYLSDPESLKPVITPYGSLVDLVPVASMVSSAIRNVLNSQDLNQGFNASQYEKATTSKLRAVGTATRAVPTFKDYGTALVKIADMFLKLNQQYAEDNWRYVVEGGVTIDAPTLTGVTDPEVEKQDAMLLYGQGIQSPVMQFPEGQLYLRNLWENMVKHISPDNLTRFVPKEDEIKRFLAHQTEMALEAANKQSVMEQMGMMSQQAPMPQPQGATK